MSTTEKVFAPAKLTKGKYGIKIGIKVEDFIKFLNDNKKETGWINLELKESLKGVQYIELDTWQPTTAAASGPDNSNDLPF
jgi:hypothetical protein